MGYTVTSFFTDLQDLSYPYNPGDKFPRDGMTVSKERIAELASENNKQGKPLIRSDDMSSQEYKKSDINRMPASELRELASNVGIPDVDSKTAGELKKDLIEHFHL